MMAFAELQVGGRDYRMACRDGDQAEFVALAAIVDGKASEARRAIGDTTEARLLLMAALLLAEEVKGLRAGIAATLEPSPQRSPTPIDPAQLDAVASALEDVASSLEKRAASA